MNIFIKHFLPVDCVSLAFAALATGAIVFLLSQASAVLPV